MADFRCGNGHFASAAFGLPLLDIGSRLGYGLLVFVEIKLHSKSGDIFEEFRREVLKIPQILECHLVSGEYDYLIKVRLQDMSAYRDMLGKILLQLPSAVESRSYVVMEEVKENGPLALEDWEG